MQDLVLTMLSPLLLLLSGVLELTYRSPANAQLPTVDLYYSVYRANSLNVRPLSMHNADTIVLTSYRKLAPTTISRTSATQRHHLGNYVLLIQHRRS